MKFKELDLYKNLHNIKAVLIYGSDSGFVSEICDKSISKLGIEKENISTWKEFEEKWKIDDDAYKKYPMYNATILVTKQIGIKNLYKLISYSHVNHYYMKPRILKSIYEENSEGLIIGSRK